MNFKEHIAFEMKIKGQGAVEYLQTYGWAILIILVIGVALWRFGVFSVGTSLNTASGFSKIRVAEAGIVYYANKGGRNNALNFTIVNGAGDFVRIESIRISGDCNDTVYRVNALDAGMATVVSGWNCSVMYPREKFEVAVNITYSTKLGSQRTQRTDSGIIRGAAE